MSDAHDLQSPVKVVPHQLALTPESKRIKIHVRSCGTSWQAQMSLSRTCLEKGGRCSMQCLQEDFCMSLPCTCTRACTSTLARAPCGSTTTCGKAQVSTGPLEAPIWQRHLKHLSHMLCACPNVSEMASCPCREGGAVCGAWSESHARLHLRLHPSRRTS